jgi:COMPASS component SWD3
MIRSILTHPEPITGLDISFDSTLIATSAYDGYVRLWDMHKATCIKTMMANCGSKNSISTCKFTPNGESLFIGTMNGELGLYDLHNNLQKAYLGHKNQEAVLDLCLTNRKETGSFLMGGSEDGRVVGWDLNS